MLCSGSLETVRDRRSQGGAAAGSQGSEGHSDGGGGPAISSLNSQRKGGPVDRLGGQPGLSCCCLLLPRWKSQGGPLLFRACTSEREERGRQRACLIRPFLTEAGNLPGGQLCGSCLSSDKNKQIGKTIFLLDSSEFYSCSGPGGILLQDQGQIIRVVGRQLGSERDNSVCFRGNKVFWGGVLIRIR